MNYRILTGPPPLPERGPAMAYQHHTHAPRAVFVLADRKYVTVSAVDGKFELYAPWALGGFRADLAYGHALSDGETAVALVALGVDYRTARRAIEQLKAVA